MMLRNLFAFSLLLAVATARAQVDTPLFVMPIWFEDALGNKDTLWVGTDTAASTYNPNPQFGEVVITEPFDSVFEVRGVHVDDWQWRTLKRVIEYNDNGGACLLPAGTRIMIHALHWPVTVSWDTLRIKEVAPCHENFLLTPNVLVFLLLDWFAADHVFCMITRSSIAVDSTYPMVPPWGPSDLLTHPFPVQGQGVKTLSGLYYTGFSGSGCYFFDQLIIGEASAGQSASRVEVFPNPSSGNAAWLKLEHPEWVAGVRVVCMATGRTWLVAEQGLAQHWALPDGPPGVYAVEVRFSDGTRVLRKWAR